MERPFRVALYSGLWVCHDAISGSLGLKVEFFDRLRERGVDVDLDVFVHDADDRSDTRVHIHHSLPSLLGDPAFGVADLHVFEFGIHYALFDAVYFLKPDRPALGVFHNVTPPALACTADDRSLLERSLRQRENLAQMHHVMCDSEFNRDDLLAMGLPGDRLSVVHLPCTRPPHAGVSGSADDPERPVELLYIGRLVVSKGVHELVEAVRWLVSAGERRFRLTMTGKREFSDPAVVGALERAAADPALAGLLVVADEPDDRELSRLYAEADAVVIPSHHEGFCLPVIEAYLHDCFVITSDAGNLPHIVGDCGMVHPAGDVDALTTMLGEYIDVASRGRTDDGVRLPVSGRPTTAQWRQRVERHAATYSHEAFERGFLDAVARACAFAGHAPPAWMLETPAGPVRRSDAA